MRVCVKKIFEFSAFVQFIIDGAAWIFRCPQNSENGKYFLRHLLTDRTRCEIVQSNTCETDIEALYRSFCQMFRICSICLLA